MYHDGNHKTWETFGWNVEDLRFYHSVENTGKIRYIGRVSIWDDHSLAGNRAYLH